MKSATSRQHKKGMPFCLLSSCDHRYDLKLLSKLTTEADEMLAGISEISLCTEVKPVYRVVSNEDMLDVRRNNDKSQFI